MEKNYHSKNVFGSEITTIKVAESLVEHYTVYIFVNIEDQDELIYNNVSYLNKDKINNFQKIDI